MCKFKKRAYGLFLYSKRVFYKKETKSPNRSLHDDKEKRADERGKMAEYQPKTVEEMQNALKVIFGPMFHIFGSYCSKEYRSSYTKFYKSHGATV